jgi:L-alanine-DL-glutamate epimerase-like enolase superfamily enzyme
VFRAADLVSGTTMKSVALMNAAQLHCIASWPNGSWIEILHDPPIAAYTHGFAMMENAPLVDKEGYLNLPQAPGWGVAINKAMLM